ncbi:hypothetical protein NEF87_002262 [Candidatus Lokiarchaeum ossiferum]|uniref:VWFA domain-containing protein n=1 Tax=Candidatus Lokiarchaeum ossiferum TaxID=2951803 RepID=A0ABY6HR41_9ARCH|nr:hypothetical protein NEF87_002262 [Candidatus Lokiarchaeum sp. B-35]
MKLVRFRVLAMNSNIPHLDILQSITCSPRSDHLSLAINLKVIPNKETIRLPFFGIWLLDLSNSMFDDNKYQAAISSLLEQIRNLPDGTIFTLITFGDPVQVVIDEKEINAISRQDLLNSIQYLIPQGSTPLRDALDLALKRLRLYNGLLLTKKIIILGDGQPDWGCSSEDIHENRFQRYMEYAHMAKEYGASIDSIGIGNDHNVLLMYNFALQSTGKFVFAEDAVELETKSQILTQQATQILHPNPILLMTPTVGSCKMYEAIQHKPTTIRFPFEKIGQNWKAWLRPFEAGEIYEFMLKLDYFFNPAAISATAPISILDFNLQLGDSVFTLKKELKLKFSDDPTQFRLNHSLMKQYNLLLNQADDINQLTIRGDASATQKIQGDETRKWDV